MPREEVRIDITAQDNASTIIQKILRQLDALRERTGYSARRYSRFMKAFEAGIKPPDLLRKGFSIRDLLALQKHFEQTKKDVFKQMERLEKAGKIDTQMYRDLVERYRTITKAQNILNKAVDEYVKILKQRYVNERNVIKTAQQYEREMTKLAERVREQRNRELLEMNRDFVRQWEQRQRWLKEQEKLAEERRISTRLQRLSRSFRRAAFNVVWSTLSILGVVWSLDAALRFSIDPLQRYVEQLSNWETIAFNVATWMAIAKREGLDISKLTGGKDTQEYLKELTDTAQLLKATFGSLDTVILMFLNNVINRTPDLKDKIVSTFQKIIDVLSRKDVIESMGNFIRGILTGIDTIIGKLPQLIQFFDQFLSVTMNALATAIKPLGSVIPGINELSNQISKASSGFEKFGIVIGSLATIMPILAPILTFFQFLLSTIQLIVFNISLLFKGLGDIGGKLGKIKPLQKFFDKVKQKVVDAFLGGLGRVVRREKLGRIFDTFKTKWVGKVVDFVKEGLKKFKTDKKAMATLSDLVGGGIASGIKKAFGKKEVKETLSNSVWSGITGGIKKAFRYIVSVIVGAFVAAYNRLREVFRRAIAKLGGIRFALGRFFGRAGRVLERIPGGRILGRFAGTGLGTLFTLLMLPEPVRAPEYKNVNITQYIHIDKIEKEADEDRFVRKLYNQTLYNYTSSGWY